MAKYVALIRGVGPGNPNMHSLPLTKFFEELGFGNVKTVISSGNVVFESKETKTEILEKSIEKELPKKLNFSRATIVRSEDQLRKFVGKNPFDGISDEKPNYLLVTFFKDGREELATVLDMNNTSSTKFMAELDKEYKKECTTRTWKTVNRILNAMKKQTSI